ASVAPQLLGLRSEGLVAPRLGARGPAGRRRRLPAQQRLAVEVDRFGPARHLAPLGVALAVDERSRGAHLGPPGGIGPGGRVDAGPPHLVGPPPPAARLTALAGGTQGDAR